MDGDPVGKAGWAGSTAPAAPRRPGAGGRPRPDSRLRSGSCDGWPGLVSAPSPSGVSKFNLLSAWEAGGFHPPTATRNPLYPQPLPHRPPSQRHPVCTASWHPRSVRGCRKVGCQAPGACPAVTQLSSLRSLLGLHRSLLTLVRVHTPHTLCGQSSGAAAETALPRSPLGGGRPAGRLCNFLPRWLHTEAGGRRPLGSSEGPQRSPTPDAQWTGSASGRACGLQWPGSPSEGMRPARCGQELTARRQEGGGISCPEPSRERAKGWACL